MEHPKFIDAYKKTGILKHKYALYVVYVYII